MMRRTVPRESFLKATVVGIAGLGALVAGIPIAGVVISPLADGPSDVWRDVGGVEDFTLGDTKGVTLRYNQGEVQSWSGATQVTVAWLWRRGPRDFVAFRNYCTHLGCGVNWLQQPRIFLCPCHGSVYNGDGTVAGGPAPRPLYRYPVRIRRGRVQIRTERIPAVSA